MLYVSRLLQKQGSAPCLIRIYRMHYACAEPLHLTGIHWRYAADFQGTNSKLNEKEIFYIRRTAIVSAHSWNALCRWIISTLSRKTPTQRTLEAVSTFHKHESKITVALVELAVHALILTLVGADRRNNATGPSRSRRWLCNFHKNNLFSGTNSEN